MDNRLRPEIPKDRIIKVNNSRKIDFDKPFKFIYLDWWYNLLTSIPVLLVLVITFWVAIFFGLKILGWKNLRIMRKRGCIAISNHCHYFDTVFANVCIFPDVMHTAVAQRNFEVPIIRRLLRIIRCFPIPGGGRGLDMITGPVGDALKRKHHILFLPEGELVVMSQTIHRFRMGAFILSCKHQAPVVPMVFIIKGRTFRGKPIGPNWIRIKLVIGEPIFPPKPGKDGVVPRDELEAMANTAACWMEETIAAHRGT